MHTLHRPTYVDLFLPYFPNFGNQVGLSFICLSERKAKSSSKLCNGIVLLTSIGSGRKNGVGRGNPPPRKKPRSVWGGRGGCAPSVLSILMLFGVLFQWRRVDASEISRLKTNGSAPCGLQVGPMRRL